MVESLELGYHTKSFLINGCTSMELVKKIWKSSSSMTAVYFTIPACRYHSPHSPYLAFSLPVVALTVLEIVWEASGENVCDPLSTP
ncbi:ankyrin repeat and sterile alpha motif domain-containing protein 1B isoform X1 [Lates japonicus]|uniref:Ankyrin repeat and sterile alpha motif domain-containing protein 1B isoform X1 n=1 Tax=Lates japonicus TaxID=270547 RepID=A0AAD3RMI8_LATJO|nr:ankyrin repeat and sterile alpha motif domain-containing protein 1B isoform X1 [Lates japonicus]